MINLFQTLGSFDVWQTVSAVVFLIAIIDPIGNMPVTLAMEDRGEKINPFRVCLYSMIILVTFLLLGDFVLKVFGIRIEYFAIAGGFVIFLMALEMLLDIVYFKTSDLGASGDLVPLAFPMYAGPGAFTALLSLTVDHAIINLLWAVVICMVLLYIVLLATHWVGKRMKPIAMYIVRKFFGVVVLGIAVQLMFANFIKVLHEKPEQETTVEQVQTESASEHAVSDDTTISLPDGL